METQKIESRIAALLRNLNFEDSLEGKSEEERKKAIRKIAEDLQQGRKVINSRFDQIFPLRVRQFSTIHWTPLPVAIRVAELLAANEESRILDVGSGCGKFCLIGALTGPGQYIGIEQRPYLVEIANRAAQELGVERVSFIHGNMASIDWSSYDAFYFYNPFYENLMKSNHIDDKVLQSQDHFDCYIEIVRNKLKKARHGTKVVTYHDFGGEMPSNYRLILREPIWSGSLKLWIKLDY